MVLQCSMALRASPWFSIIWKIQLDFCCKICRVHAILVSRKCSYETYNLLKEDFSVSLVSLFSLFSLVSLVLLCFIVSVFQCFSDFSVSLIYANKYHVLNLLKIQCMIFVRIIINANLITE